MARPPELTPAMLERLLQQGRTNPKHAGLIEQVGKERAEEIAMNSVWVAHQLKERQIGFPAAIECLMEIAARLAEGEECPWQLSIEILDRQGRD